LGLDERELELEEDIVGAVQFMGRKVVTTAVWEREQEYWC
jgi:hypothetical protein